MQTYAEQAVQKQMETVIQPQMDAQYKRTKVLFLDASPAERERIVRRAVRSSDRWREMKAAGASEREIEAAFDRAQPMKVFTYGGERDTVMSPRDSILHHKRIMRAAFVAMDPRTGFVKAYVGGPNSATSSTTWPARASVRSARRSNLSSTPSPSTTSA